MKKKEKEKWKKSVKRKKCLKVNKYVKKERKNLKKTQRVHEIGEQVCASSNKLRRK